MNLNSISVLGGNIGATADLLCNGQTAPTSCVSLRIRQLNEGDVDRYNRT